MYIPRLFRSNDRETLHAVMRDHSFASIVTAPNGAPFASHAPVLHRPAPEPHGSLIFHLARANEQSRHLSGGAEALVVFHGPHVYVSPSWYSGQENVPTWNYVVVHARGRARELDAAEFRALLTALVDANEAQFDSPWTDRTLDAEYVGELMQAIVGFELVITGLEGKLKLSQNRTPEDQAAVAQMLAKQGDQDARRVAQWMSALQAAADRGDDGAR